MFSFVLGLFVGGAVGALVPSVTAWYKKKAARATPIVNEVVAKAEDATKKL